MSACSRFDELADELEHSQERVQSLDQESARHQAAAAALQTRVTQLQAEQAEEAKHFQDLQVTLLLLSEFTRMTRREFNGHWKYIV